MTIPKMNSGIILLRSAKPAARLRLFCFPYAGGSAGIYRTWPNDLPADIEIYSIQTPRREGRPWEPLFYRLEPLILSFTEALEPYLDMPYAFFGHSLGALICFELVRALGREGVPSPIHLFVSAHSAPQLQDSCRMLHQLSDADLMREIKQLNGIPAEILESDELMTLFLPALRADIAINETYAYTPELPLQCPISAFGGWRDSLASQANLAAWRDQTYGPFSLRMFPGDHFFLHSMQRSLLHALARDLAQSMSILASD